MRDWRKEFYQNFSSNNVEKRVAVLDAAVQDGDIELLLAEDVDDVVGRRQRRQHRRADALAIGKGTVPASLKMVATLRSEK